MHTRRSLALGALLGLLGLIFGLSAVAQQVQRPADETLAERLARSTKLSEENVDRLLKALGTAVRDELKQGKEVALPGLGTFRVVQVEAHKDLRDGRPVIVPATNTIEFIPEGSLADAANGEAAKPAETVPEFKFIPLPGQTPGQKTGRTRVPPTRTK